MVSIDAVKNKYAILTAFLCALFLCGATNTNKLFWKTTNDIQLPKYEAAWLTIRKMQPDDQDALWGLAATNTEIRTIHEPIVTRTNDCWIIHFKP